MGRGKIEIKKIENPTNRQVTYSKRRTGIMKKARELTVLCDAEVSIIMFSSTGKFSDYCSPSTDTKTMFDRYQRVTGINLWSAQYENNLNHLKEINHKLRREIRQRMGEDLDGMDIKELRGLEQNLDEALKVVRHRKEMKEEHGGVCRYVEDIDDGGQTDPMYTYRVRPNQPNLQAIRSYASHHDLRLA
ncbi:hypothetical protein ZIOFF_023917 [Zingiber officinale]|uniref:Uncharacterized protein n=1 Tax=Zingiber officinale TaxID=94328 RepID=A0A8J5L5W9_ZINOF|nr:hypothetical protein ZIOFF_023917 [Zingiber officinale]